MRLRFQVSSAIDQRQSRSLSGDKLLGVLEFLMRSDIPLSPRSFAQIAAINRSLPRRVLNTIIHCGWEQRARNASEYRLGINILPLVPEGLRTN